MKMDLTKANDFRFENGVSLSPIKIPKGIALYSFEEVNRLMESYHQSELKKLRLGGVISQRELLLDFAEYSENDKTSTAIDECVDNYLDSIKQ